MPPQKPQNTALKVTSAIVVTIAVVMLVIVSTVTKAQQKSQSSVVVTSTPATNSIATSSTTTVEPSSATTSSASNSGYKDGTYSATVDYFVPRNEEEIQVSLTLKDGVITDSSIQNSESDGESAQYQESFASEYKTYVVGKNISGVNLSYVAGASDTTQAFNDAVSKIKSEAQS
jgi:uncharacterized protein with FMN-binding domain